MNYYLTEMKYKIDKWKSLKLEQLVKASDKIKAEEAIIKYAESKGIDRDEILYVKVYDTLIGE
jgi:hypothetical protein